ncbi:MULTISPECIES: GNAT family N-acetyltransferase [Bacillus]|uniref:N-acetyltransferase n=1 Tax=Bacillus glycinifermentans TaxID=1664069 RepID=A0AAJ4D194_9BACI|nr:MULTISPECIES: GNAT family N-acetyltransferase [Bacillus]KKB75543.1 GNAT family acetyltransferase [Bacillus sp. TH008]MDU0071250.1 GNAT family N-acetyltransferase [Bacillus sp. IG6]MED8019119.1 GNAT family N-acetyltransferase [Bacillus glycinifermentans]QAT63702.1 N-acetyltransferase [Bacillus glycinifermentans]WKB77571.1 GNAT family N-acetyltransferase [Bacillus glycinifermentans]
MKIFHEVPNPREYLELRNCTKDEDMVKTALEHSIFSAIIRDDHSELIGMGRIIGDGGRFFQIVDVAVKPSEQDEEIKHMIMDEIMDFLRQNAPLGAEVLLMADVPSIPFYQTYGFHYTYPQSISLSKTL